MNKKQALERAYKWAISTPLRSMSPTHAKRLAKEVKSLRDLNREFAEALKKIASAEVPPLVYNYEISGYGDALYALQPIAEEALAKAKGVLDAE